MCAKKLPSPRDPAPPVPPASQGLLAAVFDSSLLALHVVRSVRDAAGTLVDFEVVLANAAAERMVGYPVRGLRMRQQWPTALAIGLF